MSYVQHFEVKDDDGKIINFFVTHLSVGNMPQVLAQSYQEKYLEYLQKMNLPNSKHLVLGIPEHDMVVVPENTLVSNLDEKGVLDIIEALKKKFCLKQLKEV